MVHNIKLFLKFWWVIVVISVITTSAAAYLSFYVIPAAYSTTTTLYVLHTSETDGRNNDSVYQNLLASEMLVKDYKEMVKSDIIIQKVKESLETASSFVKNQTAKEIADSITVSVKPGTRLIDIRVEQKDPETATAIANKTAEIFKERSLELTRSDNVTIMSKATLPDSPDSPKPLQNIVMGLLAGLFGSIVTILFIEYVKKQFKAESAKEVKPAAS